MRTSFGIRSRSKSPKTCCRRSRSRSRSPPSHCDRATTDYRVCPIEEKQQQPPQQTLPQHPVTQSMQSLPPVLSDPFIQDVKNWSQHANEWCNYANNWNLNKQLEVNTVNAQIQTAKKHLDYADSIVKHKETQDQMYKAFESLLTESYRIF